MKLSIIIPAFNEAAHIGGTVRHLRSSLTGHLAEILVIDGGSSDETVSGAREAGAQCFVSPRKGRAAQMNFGAVQATGDVLYFLHADTIPPAGFNWDIQDAVRAGYACGCYRLKFDIPSPFLKANCWFTRFDIDAFRFGDQSLFVTREAFERVGGFSERHVVMEDQQIIRRLRSGHRFIVLKRAVITSARKYLDNGIYRTQAIFFLIYFMYRLGYSQEKLVAAYRRLIRQDKV